MSKILLFGGSFDPIHHGHLIAARCAAELLSIPRVVLIPSSQPPHKRDLRLSPPQVRAEMCRLAVRGDPLFEVSELELNRSGPNYTLLTVREVRRSEPAAELFWLIGADSLLELATWYHIGELAEEVTLVTAARTGFEPGELAELAQLVSSAGLARIRSHILETPLIDISATDIRRRVDAGRDIRYLVPESVRRFIDSHGLYRSE